MLCCPAHFYFIHGELINQLLGETLVEKYLKNQKSVTVSGKEFLMTHNRDLNAYLFGVYELKGPNLLKGNNSTPEYSKISTKG